MLQYHNFLKHILQHGNIKKDRTGTGIISTLGYQMRFDLSQGFPLVTSRKLHTKSIFHELLWFLSGNTNVHYLQEKGVSIWNEWADANGDLGPIYGAQWRSWSCADGRYIDQLTQLMKQLRDNPDSRRHIVCAWNVGEIDYMALPPCHCLFQFYVADDKLSCQLYQRSADAFLGVPFNIASYALLTHLIAQQLDLIVGEFIWTGGDCHLYQNHLTQTELLLSRNPFPLPQLVIDRKPPSLFDYRYEDFNIINYQCHPAISAPIAV